MSNPSIDFRHNPFDESDKSGSTIALIHWRRTKLKIPIVMDYRQSLSFDTNANYFTL